MILTITGDLGSGKSSVAKILSKSLGYTYISTGLLHRNIAEEYGVNALELNKIADIDETIDDKIDTYLKSLNDSVDNFIIDSRLAWHFIENTFKIYLEVDSEIGAERIFNDGKRFNEPTYADKSSALQKVQERKSVENVRFLKKYGVSCNRMENYDVIINTSVSSTESTCKLITDLMELHLKGLHFPKFWASPKLIFPMENIRLIATEEAKEVKESIQTNGFNIDYPIVCVKWKQAYFIWDGHKRTSGAIYNNLDYIPLEVIAKDDEQIYNGQSVELFIEQSFNLSHCHDWENAHHFYFVKFPELNSTVI